MRSCWNDDARRMVASASAQGSTIFGGAFSVAAEGLASRPGGLAREETGSPRRHRIQQSARSRGAGKNAGMTIVVIGQTAYGRSETVERLRGKGHDVVEVPPRQRIKNITVAPRDAGHAGKPLRKLLQSIASNLRDLWFGRHRWLGRFQVTGGQILGPTGSKPARYDGGGKGSR